MEIKKIKSLATPVEGSFALKSDDNSVHWEHCREKFAVKFTESVDGFYFSYPKKTLYDDVSKFIFRFENIIEIDSPSNFLKTNKSNILWVEPSCFWKICPIKRSLFTILLRSSFNYDSNKDNFDDALFGEYKENIYIRETKFSVMRFMFGFTNFTGSFSNVSNVSFCKHGWREEFYRKDNTTIRRKLVNPKENLKFNLIGLDSIWT